MRYDRKCKMMIEEFYPDHTNMELSDMTGLSVKQIKNYVYKYNERHGPEKMLKKKVGICQESEVLVQ